MSSYILHLVLLFFTPNKLAYSSSVCYDPWGNTLGASYQPCNSTANPGSCCNLGAGDLCTTAGLCLRQDGHANGFWYQDGCQSQDWNGCSMMCSDSLEPPWEVVPCGDGLTPGSWCCRTSGSTNDCCSNATAVTTTDIGKLILPTMTISDFGSSTSIISGTTPPTVTATVTSTITSSSTTMPANASSASTCSNKSTVAVGAGVGVSLGAVLAASVAMLIWREKTRPRKKPQSGPVNQGMYNNAAAAAAGGWVAPADDEIMKPLPLQEMDTSALVEADGNPRRM